MQMTAPCPIKACVGRWSGVQLYLPGLVNQTTIKRQNMLEFKHVMFHKRFLDLLICPRNEQFVILVCFLRQASRKINWDIQIVPFLRGVFVVLLLVVSVFFVVMIEAIMFVQQTVSINMQHLNTKSRTLFLLLTLLCALPSLPPGRGITFTFTSFFLQEIFQFREEELRERAPKQSQSRFDVISL